MAEDRFVSGARMESILFIIDATETLLRRAISCRAVMNSASSEILV